MLKKFYSEYAIQESFPEALIKLDFQDRVTYINKIASELIDITGKKLIAQWLKESEQDFRLLPENAITG